VSLAGAEAELSEDLARSMELQNHLIAGWRGAARLDQTVPKVEETLRRFTDQVQELTGGYVARRTAGELLAYFSA
jgi:hypothetical protein